MSTSSADIRLQARVSQFVKSLGVGASAIQVSVEHDAKIVANAVGVHLPKIGTILPDMAIGRITLAEPLVGFLSDREMDYVLAHETVHIAKNHLLSSGTVKLLKTLVRRDNPDLGALIDLAEVILALRGTPVEAAVTKQQEIESDVLAICLIGDRKPAVDCLTRLVAGDLSSPSHVWEALGVPLPVMSVRDRIYEINVQIDALVARGWPVA